MAITLGEFGLFWQILWTFGR